MLTDKITQLGEKHDALADLKAAYDSDERIEPKSLACMPPCSLCSPWLAKSHAPRQISDLFVEVNKLNRDCNMLGMQVYLIPC